MRFSYLVLGPTLCTLDPEELRNWLAVLVAKFSSRSFVYQAKPGV